jgi:hypothetical protein
MKGVVRCRGRNTGLCSQRRSEHAEPDRRWSNVAPRSDACAHSLLADKLGISEQTFYHWKKKYAGMGVAELRRLKPLEEEKRKLKQLVADLSLDKHMLQEAIRKKL